MRVKLVIIISTLLLTTIQTISPTFGEVRNKNFPNEGRITAELQPDGKYKVYFCTSTEQSDCHWLGGQEVEKSVILNHQNDIRGDRAVDVVWATVLGISAIVPDVHRRL